MKNNSAYIDRSNLVQCVHELARVYLDSNIYIMYANMQQVRYINPYLVEYTD